MVCFLDITEKEPKNNSRYKLSDTFQSLGSDSNTSRLGADVLVFNVKIGFALSEASGKGNEYQNPCLA